MFILAAYLHVPCPQLKMVTTSKSDLGTLLNGLPVIRTWDNRVLDSAWRYVIFGPKFEKGTFQAIHYFAAQLFYSASTHSFALGTLAVQGIYFWTRKIPAGQDPRPTAREIRTLLDE